jgi:hypothetical protein
MFALVGALSTAQQAAVDAQIAKIGDLVGLLVDVIIGVVMAVIGQPAVLGLIAFTIGVGIVAALVARGQSKTKKAATAAAS